MSAKQVVRWFLNVVQQMTYDPDIDYAETDKDFSRVRLGYNFFHTNANTNVLAELNAVGVKDTSNVLLSLAKQQAFIELHEFQHVATRKQHAEDVRNWYQGLYDNCFKEK